jgi:hypothetical protein
MIRRIRQGEVGEAKPIQFGRTASGFPTFPPSGRTITTEMVLKAQAEEDFV